MRSGRENAANRAKGYNVKLNGVTDQGKRGQSGHEQRNFC